MSGAEHSRVSLTSHQWNGYLSMRIFIENKNTAHDFCCLVLVVKNISTVWIQTSKSSNDFFVLFVNRSYLVGLCFYLHQFTLFSSSIFVIPFSCETVSNNFTIQNKSACAVLLKQQSYLICSNKWNFGTHLVWMVWAKQK